MERGGGGRRRKRREPRERGKKEERKEERKRRGEEGKGAGRAERKRGKVGGERIQGEEVEEEE